jgi:hypothetical protein
VFKDLDTYPQLLMGAHRKPAPVLGSPSLVWHIALWRLVRPEQIEEDRKKRRRLLDDYLQDLYVRLKTANNPSIRNWPAPGLVDTRLS